MKRKVFKRLAVILVGGLMASMLLAGCGDTSVADDMKETVEESAKEDEASDVNEKNDKEFESVESSEETVEDESKEGLNEKQDKDTANDDNDTNSIIREAFENVASYVGRLTMTINMELNTDDVSLDISTSSVDNVEYDSVNNVYHTSGETVVTTMGMETTTATENWIVTTDGTTESYTLVPNTTSYIKEETTENDLNRYYMSDATFTIVEETDTEYVIEAVVKYGVISASVSDTVGDVEASEDVDIPVTYVINKETNTVSSIHISISEDAGLGMNLDMLLEITPDESITLNLPESVTNSVIDAE